jgi:hypothetical protein
MVPLALQFRDHHEREDDFLLRKTKKRPRIGQEH